MQYLVAIVQQIIVIPSFPDLRLVLVSVQQHPPQCHQTLTIKDTFPHLQIHIAYPIRTVHFHHVDEIRLFLSLQQLVQPMNVHLEIQLRQQQIQMQYHDGHIRVNGLRIENICSKRNVGRDHQYHRQVHCVVNQWKQHTGNDPNLVMLHITMTVNRFFVQLLIFNRTSLDTHKYLPAPYLSESSQSSQQQGLWSAAPPSRQTHHHADLSVKSE